MARHAAGSRAQTEDHISDLRGLGSLEGRTRIALIDELLNTDLSQLRKDLQTQRRDLQAMGQDLPQFTPIEQAILTGMYRFTKVNAPILAIYADPHSGLPVRKGTSTAEAAAQDKASVEAQTAALRRDNPSARIVRLPYADHYVFISNEATVLRDVHAFIEWPRQERQGRQSGCGRGEERDSVNVRGGR